jgi:hypothetical protein
VSAGFDGTIKLWDPASGAELASMTHGGGGVMSVCSSAFVHETYKMHQLDELKDGKPQYAESDGSQRNLYSDGENAQWCLTEGTRALSHDTIQKDDLVAFFLRHSEDPQKMISKVGIILATKSVAQIIKLSREKYGQSPRVTTIMNDRERGALAATVADDTAAPHGITGVWEPGPGSDKTIHSLTITAAPLVDYCSESTDLIEQDELHCGRPLYKAVDGTSELRFDDSSGQWHCHLHKMSYVSVEGIAAATPLDITDEWVCQEDGVDIVNFECVELDGGRSSQLTRVGDRTVGLEQSSWNLHLDDGSTVRAKILDFAGQE